ncbi:MAG: flagella synthesis protein FlgN [Burkholderiales bacterium]
MNDRLMRTGALLDGLREERAAMQSFLVLLEEEQAALAAGDADKVAAGLPGKSQLLTQLTGYASRRNGLLNSLRLPEGRDGVEHLFAGQPDALALAEEWRELMMVTRKAWRANQENGALIAGRLHANVQALTVLNGFTGRSQLYGRQGQTVNAWSGRRLGAA